MTLFPNKKIIFMFLQQLVRPALVRQSLALFRNLVALILN